MTDDNFIYSEFEKYDGISSYLNAIGNLTEKRIINPNFAEQLILEALQKNGLAQFLQTPPTKKSKNDKN